MKKYDKKVYISHPYSNRFENKEMAEDIIKKLYKIFPDILFISPIHALGFMYTEVPYTDGLEMCIELLRMCDECWIFGDYSNSKGCLGELTFCKTNGIPYKIFTNGHCFKNKTDSDCFECDLHRFDECYIDCRIKDVNDYITKQRDKQSEPADKEMYKVDYTMSYPYRGKLLELKNTYICENINSLDDFVKKIRSTEHLAHIKVYKGILKEVNLGGIL